MKAGNYIFIIAGMFLSASCTKVLDKRDRTALQDELVFSDSVLARTYIDYVYDQNLPGWGGTWGVRGDLSEEAYGESKYFEGTLQVKDVTDFGTSLTSTANPYVKIRHINVFLEGIDKGTLTESWKSVLKGQAYFFRAWRYFELVKLYGGVPLVLTPLQAVGLEAKDAAFLPRSSTSACIDQIVKDLDLAIANLPGKWVDVNSDWGRVTSGAAAALKQRVLLYWASPVFNPGDLQARWQAVYDAGIAAKTNLMSNGHGLHASYENMWFSEKNNPEAVFITGYNTTSSDQLKKNNPYDNPTRPAVNGTGGGSNQPTKEFMEAFPMKDGRKIGDTAVGAGNKYTYNAQQFYKDRDPRFDKTIGYNAGVWPLNGNNNYKLWSYLVGNTSVETGKATNTGLYCRKAIDPKVPVGDAQYVGTDWMEIRFTEVLMNLAEAACGLNKLDEAYAELIEIRKRAGLEAGDDGLYGLKANMTREEMFTAILDERQIEFAFEGKRFWDLRRWKLIGEKLNGKRRTGLLSTLNTAAMPAPDFAIQRANMTIDSVYNHYMTLSEKIMDTKYAINWQENYYFFAIPQSAMDNNPKLVQNNGWGGAFDPLQ